MDSNKKGVKGLFICGCAEGTEPTRPCVGSGLEWGWMLQKGG